MAGQTLAGRNVLIVEDEYFLADDLREDLGRLGARVLQPVASVRQAQDVLSSDEPIDVAVLDINLGDEMVFPVADALAQRGIPFAFATGYDSCVIPDRFREAPRLEKPFSGERLSAILIPLLPKKA